MKKLLTSFLAMIVLCAAVDSMAATKKAKAKKIKAAAQNKAKGSNGWEASLSGALAKAKANKKPIFLLITGSTWCVPCKGLEKNVLSSKEFAAYAKKNLVLLKAELARGFKPATPEGEKIVAKYPAGSVPAIYILDGNGTVLEKSGGYGGQNIKAYLQKFKTLKNIDAIKEKKVKKSQKDKKSKKSKNKK